MRSPGRLACLFILTTISAVALAACLPGAAPIPLPPATAQASPTSTLPSAPTAVVANTPAATSTPLPTVVPAATRLPTPATDALAASVQASLPPKAFEGIKILPLEVPPGQRPVWAVYSYGLRNFNLNPPPEHFLAIFGQEQAAWQELARQTFAGDDVNLSVPDYIGEGSVTQVRIEPTRVWLQVEGGAGAHAGVFDLLSWDGSQLKIELHASAPSPGVASIQDVNGDGRPDVIVNTSDPYVFCYACGVVKIAYRVYTWDEGQATFIEVPLQEMLMGQSGHPGRAANNDAVMDARAGLWRDAMARIADAKNAAKSIKPPFTNEIIDWNYGIIKLHADALAAQAQDSGYPLLTTVFYGDYPAAANLMRAYRVDQLFSRESPLIQGTVAEMWVLQLTEAITTSATSAIEVMPKLAAAYFLRGWAEFQADPVGQLSQARTDVAKAAALASNDALFKAATAYLKQPAPTPPQQARRIQFAVGATSAEVKGQVGPGQIDEYIVRAQKGQWMLLNLFSPRNDVYLAVTGLSDGQPYLRSAAGAANWQGQLPATQDYSIKVVPSAAASTYTLLVDIPARITFKPGATSATVDGRLAANQQHEYVLKALKGQQMTVTITSPQNSVLVEVYGLEDGQPLVRVPMGVTMWTGELPGTQDCSIKAVSVGGPTNYKMTVTVK